VATQELGARPLEWNPPRQAISRVPYLPGLDGMRALAVVAVMIYHTNNGWLPGGFIGVEVFFVISGYLITLLLIGEHEKTGSIDLRQFWMRRARRLLPALFLMMALLMIYTAVFERDTLGKLRGDVLAGVGYITNWYQIWIGAGYTAALDFAPLRHLWSLAVEEQFYLLWPLIMVGLMRLGRRRLPEISRWLVLAALLIAVGMGLLYHDGRIATPEITPDAYWDVGGRDISKMDTLYLATITRATGLLIGGAFAMLWRPVAVMRGPLRNRGRELDVLALAGLAGLAASAYFLHVVDGDHADPWLFRGGFIAVDISTVMVMAAVTHRGALAGPVLGNPLLNWIGTRSYGLYLYHWPIYQIIRETAGAKLEPGEFALALCVTVVITELSYRFVEMPIRRQQVGRWWEHLRDLRDPQPRQLIVAGGIGCAAVFGFAAVSMATAELKQNEVAQSIEEAQGDVTDIGALLQSTTTTIPAPTTTAAPAPVQDPNAATTVAPTTVAPTTAAPTTSGSVVGSYLAIGDSVMAGAASPLRAAGFTVDAVESRQFGDYVGTLQDLLASGQVPQLVVVHLGTNGAIPEGDARAFFDLLAPVPRVIVLTLWVDREWIPGNNELLIALDAEYANVDLLYWDGLAPGCEAWAQGQGLSGNCYAAADGFHLSADGADYYTELILGRARELGVQI
jgi:peptidoglycan/LPS O-acetylase OafA/YrhL/lysophospholipase L1-like esterase